MAMRTGRRGSRSNKVVSSERNSSTSSRSEAAVASGWRIIERARSPIGASAWICATSCSRTPNVDEVSWRAPRARSTRTSARRAWWHTVLTSVVFPRPGAPSSTTVAGGTSQGPLTRTSRSCNTSSRPTSRERAVVPRRRSIDTERSGRVAAALPLPRVPSAARAAARSEARRRVRRGSTVGARLSPGSATPNLLSVRGPPSAR